MRNEKKKKTKIKKAKIFKKVFKKNNEYFWNEKSTKKIVKKKM